MEGGRLFFVLSCSWVPAFPGMAGAGGRQSERGGPAGGEIGIAAALAVEASEAEARSGGGVLARGALAERGKEGGFRGGVDEALRAGRVGSLAPFKSLEQKISVQESLGRGPRQTSHPASASER